MNHPDASEGPHWRRVFFELNSLESKTLFAFLEKESPVREVLLACDPHQAALLAARARGGRAVEKGPPDILVVQGGLADGRAEAMLARLRAQPGADPFRWVLLLDRRRSQGELPELSAEKTQEQLKPALRRGWLLLRFLEPARLG